MGNTRTILDLSTVHMENTEAPDWGSCRATEHQYGWILFLNPEEPNLPRWLQPNVAMAETLDCLLVNFDADADAHPRLPTWEGGKKVPPSEPERVFQVRLEAKAYVYQNLEIVASNSAEAINKARAAMSDGIRIYEELSDDDMDVEATVSGSRPAGV